MLPLGLPIPQNIPAYSDLSMLLGSDLMLDVRITVSLIHIRMKCMCVLASKEEPTRMLHLIS